MAERDTGLGWAAQDEYLVQYADVVIGSIPIFGGPAYPGQPIPKNMTGAADIIANGYTMLHFESSYQSDPDTYTLYCAAAGDYDVLVYGVVTGSGTGIDGKPYERIVYRFLSKTQNAQVTVVRLNHFNGNTDIDTYTLSTSYSSFYTAGRETNYANPTKYLPIFSSADEAIANVIISNENITKTSDGYAVACLAKWKTSNNVIINTPVLISSVSTNTDMTYNNASHSIAKLNVLRQGTRFYMSFFDITSETPVTSTMPVVDLTDGNPKTLEQVFAYIADLDHAAILVLNSPDPYGDEGGASGEEGGGGEELEDDPVEEETLPLPSVAGHGFCTVYVPSSQELGQMASYLWSGAFDVTQVIKLMSNPMDSILGLSAVPVSLSGSPEQIYLGGVALTGITMPKYTGRTSVKVDFGTVTVAERWGSYLDYAPYTDFSIYLPFIGIKPVKADDIMGKTISLMYAIDILSGGCVAYLRPAGGSVLYEWSGQCAVQIPVTGRSYDNVFQSAMSVATATLAAVAAPASAPVLSGAVASAAVQAAATKPHIERSGTVNGITGFLGQLRPYLIRTIPEAYIPADQNKFIGYPAYINVNLASVVGYNEVDSIHLENVTATGAELDEIETILKGGVIF